ncbi:hypothetical protein EVG20_g4812 [Dentipellis fragilis]|uniref:F-box domain-containing protein n=1 Tax=Dentipellis fragilis TaxID=205917 RepID=A0A4Y9YX42_9AGAM|nr:hypothetical protein EVG20_g4812 [Dentipellis fragilis]
MYLPLPSYAPATSFNAILQTPSQNSVETMDTPPPPMFVQWTVTGSHPGTSTVEDDEWFFSEDDDILGVSRRKPVKRKRTKASQSGSPSTSRRTAPEKNDVCLKDMLEMPLDALFEIFSHLAPADLLQLARTSKNLRSMLLSRKTCFLWKRARNQVPGPAVPDPPDDVSEPSWAHLIFGGPFCYNCDAKGATRVDFALRRRLCKTCMAEGLVISGKFQDKFPEMPSAMLDMVPYTNVGRWGSGTAGERKYYWGPDIHNMYQDMVIEMATSTSSSDFYERKVSAAQEAVASSRRFDQWVSDVALWRAENIKAAKSMRKDEITRRCLAMGYDSADLESSEFSKLPAVCSEKPVTEKAWSCIRVKLASWLADARQKRVHRLRLQKVEEIYDNLTGSFVPFQLCYLPSATRAATLPCFQDLMQKDPREEISNSLWDEAAHNLHNCLTEWANETRERFVAMLPPGNYEPTLPMEFTSRNAPAAEVQAARKSLKTFAGPLELAISVFSTDAGGMPRILVGREYCNAWRGTEKGDIPKDLKFKFYQGGSDIAARTVTLAGMNPETTTALMMDQELLYFQCTECNIDKDKKCAYLWRYWVNPSPAHHHPLSQLELVDLESVTLLDVEEYETPRSYGWPIASPECVLCNRCGFSDYKESVILEHLHSAHGLATAVEDEDFFRRSHPGHPQEQRQAGKLIFQSSEPEPVTAVPLKQESSSSATDLSASP